MPLWEAAIALPQPAAAPSAEATAEPAPAAALPTAAASSVGSTATELPAAETPAPEATVAEPAIAVPAEATAAEPAPPAPAPADDNAALGGQAPGLTQPFLPKAPPELATSAAEAAAAALPEGEKFDEDNPVHRLARCRAHIARSEWFDAVGDCRKAAELEPKSAEPYAELMRIYVTLQSYSDGAEAARAVLVREPDNAPAYYYLGWSLSGGQDYPAAIQALRKAVSLDPGRVEYRQGLGMTYCLDENFAQGIGALEEARKLGPDNAKTKDLLAETRSLLTERLAPFQRAVKTRPEDPTTHAMLGSRLQRYGFREAALAEYDAALAKIPAPIAGRSDDDKRLAAELYYNRGVIYRELGRGDSATPAFVKSFEIEPSLAPQAYYFIGLIAYDKGDTDGAILALRKSVEGAPKVIENRTALARAYEKSGNKQAAREQREEIARLQEQAADETAPLPQAAGAAGASPQPAPAGSDATPTSRTVD